MKTRRRRLECDCLEPRTLLSGTHGHMSAHHHAKVAMSGAAHLTAPAQVDSVSPVTGGGLVNVPAAPPASDVMMMQSAASGDELVLFLTQFEVSSGTNAATQQTANSILNDARNVELALNVFANGLAVTLPPNIEGNDQALAQQMIAGVRAGNVDQTYSSLIIQAETAQVNEFQQMATSAQTASIQSFAAGILPTVQADLAAAQGTGTLPPVSNTPSSTMLSSSDLSTLETYYSIDLMERFLAQMTLFVTNRNGIAQYAAKLIGDHEGANIGLGAYANSTGTYLPAAISASNAGMTDTVIAALGAPGAKGTLKYERVYLNQMIMGHTAALQYTRSAIATTTNPDLKQFEINVYSTIFIHRLAAVTLRQRLC